MSQAHERNSIAHRKASPDVASPPPPTLTSDLLDLLLAHMIRRTGIDSASSASTRPSRFHPSDAYLTSRYRRDPIHTGRRVYAILCVSPSSAAMPLVRRAALTVVWWYNMDLASRDGRIDLLDELVAMRRAHNAPLDFSPMAIDLAAQMGHADVLQWWFNESKMPLGANLHALDLASETGHRHVLDWIEIMAKEGRAMVRVQWDERSECYSGPSWSRPGQLVLYSPNLRGLKHAIQTSSFEILEWWLPVLLDRFLQGYPPDVIEWIGAADLPVVEWWHAQDPSFPLAPVFARAAQHGRLDAIVWIMDQGRSILTDTDIHVAFMYAVNGSARLQLQVMQLLFPLVAPTLLERFSLIDSLCHDHRSGRLAAPVQVFEWFFATFPEQTLPGCEEMLIFATLHGHMDLLDWIVANHDPHSRKVLSLLGQDVQFWDSFVVPVEAGYDPQMVGRTAYRLRTALTEAFHLGYVEVLEWWFGCLDREQTRRTLAGMGMTVNRTIVHEWTLSHFRAMTSVASATGKLPLLSFIFRKCGYHTEILVEAALYATTSTVLDWWQSNVAIKDLTMSDTALRQVVRHAVSDLNVDVLEWWCRKWNGGPLNMSALYEMDELFAISLADWPMLQWYLSMGYPVFPEVGFPSVLVDEAIATGDWQGLEWWYHELGRTDSQPMDGGLALYSPIVRSLFPR
ncbi:hypothetical protein BCR44DRAFT_1513309 [Catenaria anguillulae PL171]|uniref:Ankyrin repeat-containing domain protein n=1 Tax=Catenaria anguillulae PL171 TaxID=765915 RepID=A0A1Y2HLW1_9FUNG|nr:hypothetical protein BCR44DRAFT_1513309 [Catenaria anguillulae PL171]